MSSLNTLSSYLIKVFGESDSSQTSSEGLRVSPIVSEIASLYEKLRNAMDYRDDEVVLRAAIERILKRRHFYGGKGETIANPLLRELIWARYFPDGSFTESWVTEVEKVIDMYLSLRTQILAQHKIDENTINTLMYHLISSHLTYLLSPNKKRETMTNFMFHVMKDKIKLEDDPESTRDVQVFVATRRAFAKDDLALIHYHLFVQYFGKPTPQTVSSIAKDFMQGYQEIQAQLKYPLRHKIYSFVKRNTPPFLILEEILLRNMQSLDALVKDEEKLTSEVVSVCNEKYTTIRSKVTRAIIRSLIFLVLTKTVIALSVEGTFESIVYGEIMWNNIILNIIIPPIFLAAASLFIRTPGSDNTQEIVRRIKKLLFEEPPKLTRTIVLHRISKKRKSILYPIFSILWICAFFASFGLVIAGLNGLGFNIISQFIFVFFLTIVCFLIYRIYQTAHTFTVLRKQTLFTPVVDFLFLPIARVGRYITEGVSHVNIFLVLFDLLIEAPFKGLFSFFEQWFMFLHAKREYLD
ncbi:MAG TPA: hypothetical protein PLD54_04490 [Candidatus Levybacteria bacterium]|nr:hypothetical protein [Candidatus Levybacteria bacterium]